MRAAASASASASASLRYARACGWPRQAASSVGSVLVAALGEHGVDRATARGVLRELVTRELPLSLGPVHVEMVWHLRQDANPAHRWLREQMLAAVQSPSTAAIATAVRSTLPVLSPATQMRPERTR